MQRSTQTVEVQYQDWGEIEYGQAWDRQEQLLSDNLAIKTHNRHAESDSSLEPQTTTQNFILCTHPHVYTLGKSGVIENLLVNNNQLSDLGVTFYKTNRGGDITYHGPGQIVGYPNLDLEAFYTDIGRYMRELEEVIIRSISDYGLIGDRDPDATGVWLDVGTAHARKICALGVKTSRWVTLHGFALNVNTDLSFFDHIVPCGILDKGVTSIARELGRAVDPDEVKQKIKSNFEQIFRAKLIDTPVA